MGAAIGAISAAAPAGNAVLQHYEANRQMNFQSEESAINRDWQTAEAEKARQFSAQQLQKQMDYNSPVYQSNELRKAGLNPVLAMQNGSAVASVSGGSSAPVASPVQGVSPVQGQPVDLNIPQAVQSMGAFLKSIAEAKKLGVQTDYLEQTFYDSVAKFHNEQTLSSLEVASKEMDNYIKHRVKDARIEQAWEELAEVGTRIVMNQATSHETFARADLDKALERMNEALANYHGQNALYVKLQVENFARDFESMLRLRESEIMKNRGSAKESSARASNLAEDTRGKSLVNNIKEATNSYDIDNAIYNADVLEFFRQSSVKEQLYQQLERDIKLSRAYKNSDSKKRIDATLENFRKILGINVNVGMSGSASTKD